MAFRRIRSKSGRHILICCLITLVSGWFLVKSRVPVSPSPSWPVSKSTLANKPSTTSRPNSDESLLTESLPHPRLLSSQARRLIAEAASMSDTTHNPTQLATLTVIAACNSNLLPVISKLIGLPSSFRIKRVIVPCLHRHTKQAAEFRRVKNVRIFVQDIESATADGFLFAHAASITNTSTILFLDAVDVNSLLPHVERLLSWDEPTFPVGPRGLALSSTGTICVGSSTPHPATFLVPPFLAPVKIVQRAMTGMILSPNSSFWLSLGHRISVLSSSGMGGIVIPAAVASSLGWCEEVRVAIAEDVRHPPFREIYQSLSVGQSIAQGNLTIVLPSPLHLREFGKASCLFAQSITGLRIKLHADHDPTETSLQSRWFHTGDCWLWFDLFHQPNDAIRTLLSDPSEVVIVGIENANTDHNNGIAIPESHSVTIRIPTADLRYCDWIGTLTLDELKRWHSPRIDITVITNNRPWSLNRLLTSLNSARYFGDRPALSINMEQTADPSTRRLSDSFTWKHGLKSVKHRILLVGLMPAIVESWYPSNNDDYGLLLEDDIEVSPLFYAWTKMALLRYRYGTDNSTSRALFGISLYQQKVLELLPEGRKPFSAQAVLSSNSPYLSQIPCSWGAVFFPEHWREFHDYLVLRLSETRNKLSDVMVPDVRSNKWTKSWKKFFIEFVYLRGYVMLYPNYDGFVSLSTNHLEVGSHVKALPQEIRDRRKQDFTLPLMALPNPSGDVLDSGLLDMPNSTLPEWNDLPVFDLHGKLSSVTAVRQRGFRRREVFQCSSWNASTFDANELFCQ